MDTNNTSSQLGTVLEGGLFPLVLQHLTKQDLASIRLCSQRARVHVDESKKVLVLKHKYFQKGVSPTATCAFARGVVSRGCQPVRLELLMDGLSRPSVQELLASFNWVTRGSGLPTETLVFSVALLHPDIVTPLASSLPNLTELNVDRSFSLTTYSFDEISVGPARKSSFATQGLLALLSKVGAAGPANGAVGGGRPRLPRLRRLHLGCYQSYEDNLDPALCDALATCTQLQAFSAPAARIFPQVQSMTQLRSLELSDAVRFQPCLLPPGLTRLRIAGGYGRERDLQASLGDFTTLRSLQDLSLPKYSLYLQGAEELTALTFLEAGKLLLPAAADEEEPAAEAVIQHQRLPPQLAELVMGNSHGRASVQVLAGLEAPSSLARIHLLPRLYAYGPPIMAPGGLTAVGEAALCDTFRLLGGRAVWHGQEPGGGSLWLRLCGADYNDGWLADAYFYQDGQVAPCVAPSPTGHGGWLPAVGQLQLAELTLEGVDLSVADMRALASGCGTLQKLGLSLCDTAPSDLRELAALPRLKQLQLGVKRMLEAPDEEWEELLNAGGQRADKEEGGRGGVGEKEAVAEARRRRWRRRAEPRIPGPTTARCWRRSTRQWSARCCCAVRWVSKRSLAWRTRRNRWKRK